MFVHMLKTFRNSDFMIISFILVKSHFQYQLASIYSRRTIEVYSVQYKKEEFQPFAVKVLKVSSNMTDEIFREVSLAPTIHSTFIVPIYQSCISWKNTDVGDNDTIIEIWMPKLEDTLGSTITNQQKAHVLTKGYLQDVATAVAHAALGLKYLHDRNYLHRDIKPANIGKFHSGRWVLIDLGKLVQSSSSLSNIVPSDTGTPFVQSFPPHFSISLS